MDIDRDELHHAVSTAIDRTNDAQHVVDAEIDTRGLPEIADAELVVQRADDVGALVDEQRAREDRAASPDGDPTAPV